MIFDGQGFDDVLAEWMQETINNYQDVYFVTETMVSEGGTQIEYIYILSGGTPCRCQISTNFVNCIFS